MITDDKFIRGNATEPSEEKLDKSALIGIANKDKWEAIRQYHVGRPKISEGDPLPAGTTVSFNAPDGTEYNGKVAAKSGEDYIVEVSDGESYIVPPGKLAKVTPTTDKIKEAMKGRVLPPIDVVEQPKIEIQGRCVVRVAFKAKRPTDNDLICWASRHYPDWRLVDAINGDNREIGLIFEVQAAEDVRPQGGDSKTRSPGLMGEEIEGTGVIADSNRTKEIVFDHTANIDGEEVTLEVHGTYQGSRSDLDSGIDEVKNKLTGETIDLSKLGADLEKLEYELYNRAQQESVEDEAAYGDYVYDQMKEGSKQVSMRQAIGSTVLSMDKIAHKKEILKYKEIINTISKAGGIVCGGSVRDMYLDKIPSDIDVFVPKADVNNWYEYLRKLGFKQRRRKFYANNIIIDVVGTKHASPEELVKTFDCDVCKWWIDKKGNLTPLNENVRNATNNKVATFNIDKDLFGSSHRRALKLSCSGWKVAQVGGTWEEYSTRDGEEAAEEYFSRFFPENDPSDFGYFDSAEKFLQDEVGYTDIWEYKFSIDEEKTITSPKGEDVVLTPGENFITIESRYGYVDAWLNDEYQIFDWDQPKDPKIDRVDRSRLEAMKAQVNDWLNQIGISDSEPVESAESAEQDWVCSCDADNPAGYPCWRCGGPESGATSFQERRSRRIAQLGEPGDGEKYDELVKAAEWVLSRFNDSNPEYYATPQDTEMAGDEIKVVRLAFSLHKRDDGDELTELYMTKGGALVTSSSSDSDPVRGFVQVDSEANLPMVMLETPVGPESIQEYGFNFQAIKKEIIKIASYGQFAMDVYQDSKENPILQALLEEKLSPLGIEIEEMKIQRQIVDNLSRLFLTDPEFFEQVQQYVPMREEEQIESLYYEPTEKIERDPTFNLTETKYKDFENPFLKESNYDACEAEANDVLSCFGGYSAEAQAEFDARLTKLGVDQKAKEYWSGYFKDYGKMWTRDVPKKKHNKSAQKIDEFAKNYWINYYGSGVYNDSWYGQALVRDIPRRNHGDPSPQETAPKKEDQPVEKEASVEMFKHMSKKACADHGVEATPELLERFINVGLTLQNKIAQKEAIFGLFEQPKTKKDIQKEMSGLQDVAATAIQLSESDPQMSDAIYRLVYDYLAKNPSFLTQQNRKNEFSSENVGYILLYALRESPKALKQFKKHIDSYQQSVSKQNWQQLQEEARNWRKDKKQKKQPAEKPAEKPTEEPAQPAETQLTEEELDVIPEEPEEAQQTSNVPGGWLVIAGGEAYGPYSEENLSDIANRIDMSEAYVWKEGMESAVPASEIFATASKTETVMNREADKAPGPWSYNAPGKDDKKDYDHKEPRLQPAREKIKFDITRMYSTTSSADNGYIFMELAWKPELEVHPRNIQQQIVSYVKGLESTKEFHDFGIMGKIRIIDIDYDAGVARVKFRCSETRGVPTMSYSEDIDKPIPITGIR